MGDLADAIKKIDRLQSAIENALEREVADVVRNAIAETAIDLVYDAYDPEFLSRRDPKRGGGNTKASKARGGITDPSSVTVYVSGNELIAADEAPWQQLWGGEIPNSALADAIATGDKRFNMAKAGPRPFHAEAKKRLLESGEIEKALRAGLKRQGYDVSGLEFEIK